MADFVRARPSTQGSLPTVGTRGYPGGVRDSIISSRSGGEPLTWSRSRRSWIPAPAKRHADAITNSIPNQGTKSTKGTTGTKTSCQLSAQEKANIVFVSVVPFVPFVSFVLARDVV